MTAKSWSMQYVLPKGILMNIFSSTGGGADMFASVRKTGEITFTVFCRTVTTGVTVDQLLSAKEGLIKRKVTGGTTVVVRKSKNTVNISYSYPWRIGTFKTSLDLEDFVHAQKLLPMREPELTPA